MLFKDLASLLLRTELATSFLKIFSDGNGVFQLMPAWLLPLVQEVGGRGKRPATGLLPTAVPSPAYGGKPFTATLPWFFL